MKLNIWRELLREGADNGGGGGNSNGAAGANGGAAAGAAGGGAAGAAGGAAAGAGGANNGGGGAAFSFDAIPFNDASKAVITAKGFKDVNDIVQWGANAERYMGVPPEQLLKLPKSLDDATAMKEVWQKLGAGKSVDDYKLDVPPGKDGKPGDDSFAKVAAKWFLDHDVPVSKAQGLTKAWNAHAAEVAKQMENRKSQQYALEDTALKTEWNRNGGHGYETNVAVAKRGMDAIGIRGDILDAIEDKLGHAATMKWAYEVGAKIGGNGEFTTGDTPANFDSMSPAQAQMRINALKGDKEWIKGYMAGDVAKNQEMTRLHAIAFPEPRR